MNNRMKLTAIVGSYRKGGIIDAAVDALLAAAGKEGAESAETRAKRHVELIGNQRRQTDRGCAMTGLIAGH